MAASQQTKLYDLLQERIEKPQDKINSLRGRLIALKYERMQIKMLNDYKGVEGQNPISH